MSDLLSRPMTAFLWWCVPLAIGFAGQLAGLSQRMVAALWAVSFIWMGTGCILNAIRCGRLHCYMAGPIFVLAALAEVFAAFGSRFFGAHAQTNIAGAALLLALISFAPELIRGHYLRR